MGCSSYGSIRKAPNRCDLPRQLPSATLCHRARGDGVRASTCSVAGRGAGRGRGALGRQSQDDLGVGRGVRAQTQARCEQGASPKIKEPRGEPGLYRTSLRGEGAGGKRPVPEPKRPNRETVPSCFAERKSPRSAQAITGGSLRNRTIKVFLVFPTLPFPVRIVRRRIGH
jgi:hypothetical protein